MEDNAAIHKAKLIKDEHQKRGGTVVDWLANSLDLNPIENVWRVLKARIAKRWPRTHEEMKTVMLDEWYKLTHQDIAKYCSGEVMRERCRAVLAANGGPINW
jgi:transposase